MVPGSGALWAMPDNLVVLPQVFYSFGGKHYGDVGGA